MSRQYLIHLFHNSLKILLANKKRSFLTMSGIIIGVASVIIIMAIGAGAQNLILSQVKSFGADLVGVLPGKAENGPPVTLMGINITTLTTRDVEKINDKKYAPHVVAAVGFSKAQAIVNWKTNEYSTTLNGVGANYLDVEGGEVVQGRFFTKAEDKGLARVAVLGDTVRQEIFGQNNPLGQKIKINKKSFLVIGVMKKRGTVGFQDYDDLIFAPVTTVQKIILGVNHLNIIRAKIDDKKNTAEAIDNISAILRANHNITDNSGANDDFTVRSTEQALNMLSNITDALKIFLTAMAILALIVGGIGIMNIMLIRVTEKTREIGLRKAIGATNKIILSEFLIETSALTIIGGIIGIILGIIISLIIAFIANHLGYDWPYLIPLSAILLGLFVSGFTGLIFGVYPAKKASALNPITALRYE